MPARRFTQHQIDNNVMPKVIWSRWWAVTGAVPRGDAALWPTTRLPLHFLHEKAQDEPKVEEGYIKKSGHLSKE